MPARAFLAFVTALLCSATFCPPTVLAQAMTDQPDAGVPTPDAPAARVPVPVPAPVLAPPQPPTAPPPIILEKPILSPVPFPVEAQAGTRLALRVQDPYDRRKMDDVGSQGEADVVFWGKVHPFLKWQAGFVGSFGELDSSVRASVLDLVAKIELADAFNLWFGRMPVPADRASLSTRWGLATWTMPARYGYSSDPTGGPRPSVGARSGDFERGNGATLWGQVAGGRLKYYVGVFGLEQPITSPLLSARLSLSILNPEPGFLQSSAYYGSKDVLSLGLGAQRQVDGSEAPEGSSAPTSDFNLASGDLLFEKNGGSAGVVDFEASVARVWGKNEAASYQGYALLSYLVPLDIGIGRFQPLVRVQYARKSSLEEALNLTSVDAQLGYIVDGFHARLLGVYQYTKLGSQTQNAVLLGVQLLSHAR